MSGNHLAGMQTMDSVDVEGRRVFVRVDFNVPLDKDLQITDDSRIQAVLPTIRTLRERGARVVLASHLGRPEGTVRPELSLEPVGARLAELLGVEVLLPDDCVGNAPNKLIQNLREGQIMLLENLRFHAEETAGDENFARSLAGLADVYVNDAFGAAHRAHASVVGVPRHVADCAAGPLMARELEAFEEIMTRPREPFVAIVGGAKVSDKIGVLGSLLGKVDSLLIGGAMAYTFLKAQGHDMGDSLVEDSKIDQAKNLLLKAKSRNVDILLPGDHVIVQEVDADAPTRIVATGEVPEGWKAVDIGPDTRSLYAERVSQARTVFWNGPMGIFEIDAFAAGTEGLAQAVAQSSATSVVGGGDSVAAVRKAGVVPFITHVSTGGGASLELLEGKVLPGVEALQR
jgi:phosphoglycerate kinase